MLHFRAAIFLCALQLHAAVLITAGQMALQLDEKNGTVEGVTIAGHQIAIEKRRALFSVRDIKAGPGFVPLLGPVKTDGPRRVIDAVAKGLNLSARIVIQPRNEQLFVSTTVSNHGAGDRGLILTMTLHLPAEDVVWAGDLANEVRPQKDIYYGNNRFPISALRCQSQGWGLAAAIPPTNPVFYDTHYRNGEFGIYYYLGVTPATRDFPNRAEVAGLLCAVSPQWGFRSALEKYYAAFPDFYAVRAEKSGLWCFHMDPAKEKGGGCTFYEAGGQELQPVPGYQKERGAGYESKGYSVSTAWTPAEWAAKNGVPEAVKAGMYVFPYTIVGQRQIYLIPEKSLVEDYDRAMKIFQNWTIDKTMPYQNPTTANGFRSVKELKEIIVNSGLHDQSGKYVILPRYYTGNTLTFPLNPNPRLFAGNSKMTIAKYTLDYYVPHLIKGVPEIKGFYIDSMGRWNNFLNYRRDHFAYAKYPLNVDLQGNPVLRNLTSHYEFLEELKKRLHSTGRLLFANGVNEGGAKAARNGRTDYDAARPTSRFFLAALCDVAGTESGARTTVSSMQSFRVMMGPKPYATLGKTFADDAKMVTYFKRGVAMGIFSSLGDLYYTTPAWRHNVDLLTRVYLPLLRAVQQAGWEPVRGVAGVGDVVSERFGKPGRGPVFLTLLNEGAGAKTLSLQLDPQVLGSQVTKAADRVEPKDTIAVRGNVFTVPMQPGQLRVLELLP
jgi:hypothetical protein